MARILVVDDEQEIRNISADVLQIEGFVVDTAKDGDEALHFADSNKYDLALVDLVLPGSMNGLDIIERLRTLSPNIKIIAFTGFGGMEVAEKTVKAGADDFMTKPFWANHLIQAVRKLVEEEAAPPPEAKPKNVDTQTEQKPKSMQPVVPRLLSGFDNKVVASFIKAGNRKQIKEGGELEVKCNRELAVILAGSARCLFRNGVVGDLKGGDAIGEASLFIKSSDIDMILEAETDLDVVVFSKDDLRKFFMSQDKKFFTRFAANVIIGLSSKVFDAYEQIAVNSAARNTSKMFRGSSIHNKMIA